MRSHLLLRFLVFSSSLLCGVTLQAQSGTISTYAGAFPSGMGGPAIQAALTAPGHMAYDQAGNLYVVGEAIIYRITPDGIVNILAGNGLPGFSGDGGPATLARLYCGVGSGIVVDSQGNVVFADRHNNRIRKISPTGTISTIAGTGKADFAGDKGPATVADLNYPNGIALDAQGNLYISDVTNVRIRKVDLAGNITTIAGVGSIGYGGDGGPALAASLNSPGDLVFDSTGNLYVGDGNNLALPMITPDGTVNTVAGANQAGSPQMDSFGPISWLISGLAIDQANNLYVAAGDRIIRRDLTRAFTSLVQSYSGSLAIDPKGNLLVSFGSVSDQTIKVLQPAGTFSTIAGVVDTSGSTGPFAFARTNLPSTLAFDPSGSLVVGEGTTALKVRKFTSNGIVSINGGPDLLHSMAIDKQGNMYVSTARDTVLRIDPAGNLTNYAGSPTPLGFTGTFGGDGGPATQASLNNPGQMALDGAGNLFISDTGNNRIRKVTTDGMITTVVGTGVAALGGDKGPATAAQLNGPYGVAIDGADNLYISDNGNYRIRRVTPDGIINTYAGNGQSGFTGDGGPAISAQLSPTTLALDAQGNLYFNSSNSKIRKITAAGLISTVAGNGINQSSGDGGPAVSASFAGSAYDGGRLVPLYFASDGQVNGILPNGIPDSTTLQIIVQNGNVLSVPQSILIGATQPAVFTTDGSGAGQGHVYGANTGALLLADSANPVHAGDTLVLYATGLGPVSPAVPEGQAAPSDPISLPVNPIQVTVQGMPAQVVFAGLAPGFTGVFQVNAIVPAGVAIDAAAPLILTAGSQSSPPVTIAITQ